MWARGNVGACIVSCRMAEEVWCGTRLKLPFFQDPPNDFMDIVWEIKERCKGLTESCSLLLCGDYGIVETKCVMEDGVRATG